MLRVGLRVKLLLGVFVLLLPILWLLLWTAQVGYEQQRAAALERQVRVAETVASLVDTVFDDAIDLGWALTSDLALRSFDPSLATPHLQQLAERYPQFLSIDVFDARGNNVGWSEAYAPGEVRLNVAHLAHFQQVMATGQPIVSPVLQAIRWPGKPIAVIAVPVLEAGRAVGTLHLVLDLEYLPTRLVAVRLRPEDAVGVIDPQGRVAVLTLRPDLNWEERDASRVPEIQAALAGQAIQTDDHRSPFLGDMRAAGFVRSARHGWVLALSSPTAIVFGPIDEAYRRQLAVFAVIAVLGAAGAWTLAGYLLGPLHRLAAAARAAGRGDLGRRVVVRTADELEELAGTFNTTAARLQETIGRLQETKGRLEAMFGSMVEAVIVVDTAGRLVDTNAAGLALAGLSRENLGQPMGKYFDRADLRYLDGRPVPVQETAIARALRGEVVPAYEVRLRKPSGEQRMISITAAPVRDEREQVTFAVAVIRDITEERRHERARLALARVSQRVATAGDIDQALATAVTELTTSFDLGLTRVWLWDEVDQVLVLRASAGLSTRTARTGSQYARFHLGQFRIGGIAAQIAVAIENARLLGQLRVALKLREEFIAAAAHELKTPVTVLKGYAGLLRRREIPPPDLDKMLEMLERSADRVGRLARDLLDAADLERGTLPFQLKRFDLAEVAREVASRAQVDCPRHALRLRTKPAPVVADRDRIAQVIWHLLDNAVKYQSHGGPIDVTVGAEGGDAVLSVRDYGVGIPPERWPHVFEPMYEPIPPGARGYVGVVGLGPAVSKRIVELHQGRLWFASVPGQGSAFHFALPLAQSDEQAA